MRILVIEDEKKVARFIERGLKEERFAVDVATDGEEGLFRAQSNDYDLIVLDVLMPKKDGFQVLRELRAARCRARVLMLTARDSVADRVHGLEGGADDYLVKPFAFAEFLARIRVLLRRERDEGPTLLNALDLTLDLKSRKVTRAGKPVALSAKEFGVLEFLLRHPGEVITRTQLAEHASQTANKEIDGDALFEYGYKFLYTPDYRGGALLNVPGLTIADFAVRTVTDTLAVTAVIDKQNHLRLNTWQVVAGIGQIASLGATTISINNLAAGNKVVPATLVDMTPSPTVESEMDYLTGHIEDGKLRLDVWRIAAEPGF